MIFDRAGSQPVAIACNIVIEMKPYHIDIVMLGHDIGDLRIAMFDVVWVKWSAARDKSRAPAASSLQQK